MLNTAVPPWWAVLTSDQESLKRLRNTAPTHWRVPNDVVVVGDRLHYDPSAFTVALMAPGVPVPFKLVNNPGLRLLADFLSLAEAEDQDIEAYARRWGVLGVCTHGFPPASCPSAPKEEWRGRFCPPQGYPGRCSEPLFIWRAMARWARALLNALAMLRRKESIANEDWATLTNHGKLTRQSTAEMSRLEQWKFVGVALSAWLGLISYRPGLRITGDEKAEFALTISQQDFSQLLAVLGLELLFQVTRARRLLTCAGCGAPYIPKRLPTRGERSYCANCGVRAARRDAAARWRARNTDYFRQRRSKAKEKRGSKPRPR